MSIRPETIKHLEENLSSKLLDISLGNEFLDLTPRAKAPEVKINKREYIKLISFCKAKEPINKMKRQPSEWEKYLKVIHRKRG